MLEYCIMPNTQPTLYKYITDNIGPDGVFTAAVLPDDRHPTVPHPLGAEDAFFYTADIPPDQEGAQKLTEALRLCLRQPSPEHRKLLYELARRHSMAAVCDPFADGFAVSGKEEQEQLLALARELFYNARHREPLKFALLLFGFCDMRQLREFNPVVWRDILNIARCEEFTFFFLYACRRSSFMPQHDVWVLLGCTKGWGKIYALNEARCEDKERQLWLVKNGYDLDVEYPPLSVRLLQETRLPELLRQESVDYATFKGAAAIINNFLLLLADFAPSLLQEHINPEAFDLPELLRCFLRHALTHAASPEDLLEVQAAALGLRTLEARQRWFLLSDIQLQELLAQCDAIVYAHDWSETIAAQLVSDDELNYPLCDFAIELGFDVWPQLFGFFVRHPQEYRLAAYLLGIDEERAELVLGIICAYLELYQEDEQALLVPLRYLHEKPGHGEAIVCAALTGMYDWPRGTAAALLSDWGEEFITPPIRSALLQARRLSCNPVVSGRIEALLAGRSFDLETESSGM